MPVKKKGPSRLRMTAIVIIVVIAIVALVGIVKVIQRITLSRARGLGNVFPVSVEVLKKQDVNIILSYEGSIEGDPQNTIYSSVAGVFDHNAVREGDYVYYNQPVTYIDRNIIGENYQLAPVPATATGVVIHLYYLDRGAPVSTTNPIADIANINKLKVVLNIGQADMLKLAAGQKARIYPEDDTNDSVEAYVDSVTPFIDLSTLTGQATVKAPNPGNRIKVGMTADVDVYTGVTNIFMVPDVAVVAGESEADVYLVDGNKARIVKVTPGYTANGRTEIESPDIHEGDQVVTSGSYKLNDGSLVRIMGSSPGLAQEKGQSNAVPAGKITGFSNDSNRFITPQGVPSGNWTNTKPGFNRGNFTNRRRRSSTINSDTAN